MCDLCALHLNVSFMHLTFSTHFPDDMYVFCAAINHTVRAVVLVMLSLWVCGQLPVSLLYQTLQS